MIDRYKRKEMGRIWEDKNKWQKRLDVELAVLEAEAKLGLAPQEGVEDIKKKAGFTVERINEIDAEIEHDMNAFIMTVQERIGSQNAWLFHRWLTSYDSEEPATALIVRESIEIIKREMEELMKIVLDRAKEHRWTIMIGRTHGQHAGITTFGLQLLNYYYDLETGVKYLSQAEETMSYGKISGIVGAYTNLDPRIEEIACRKLGIKPAKISTQILSRIRHASLVSVLAIIASSMEKIATDIRNLSRPEIGELREPFKRMQKGSSAKGHKRNPVITERVCGLARIIRAYTQVALENVVTWEQRDITQSSPERIVIPDSFQLLDYMLHKMIWVVGQMEIFPERMEENIEQTYGTLASQEVRTLLLEKGMNPEEAYRLVQKLSFQALEKKEHLQMLILLDKKSSNYLQEEADKKELRNCFNWRKHLVNAEQIFDRFGA